MNLDELRSAQAKERRKDSLQHLRDSFYDDVGAYVADLRAARDRRAEQVENPFEDDDIRRLSDEVETAEEVAEALYERRVGKVVKLASFAAADMSVDEDGMTAEERRLFDDLVERITANKSQVLDVLAGESPVSNDAATPNESGTPEDPAGTTAEREAESPAAGSEPADAAPQTTDPEGATANAGALAGAMGGDGSDPTATDSAPEPTEGDATARAAEPGEVGVPDDTEETPVPPEPAPPGAVGVDDDGGETDEASGADGLPIDGRANDADEEIESGATTDGGPVPETGASDGPDAGPDPSSDRTTVRITRDVGAIFGVDEREYDLASEDVVSLPAENADPLVQRDAAERID